MFGEVYAEADPDAEETAEASGEFDTELVERRSQLDCEISRRSSGMPVTVVVTIDK